jgi:hypothetical protein
MFALHLIQATMLGPFINFYTLIFRRNSPWLMNNLLFSRVNTFWFWMQTVSWALALLYFYLYLFTDSVVSDFLTVAYLVFAYTVRCSTIAGKYAIYPKALYKKVKKKKISTKEIYDQFMLKAWYRQDENIIHQEIDSSIQRMEIDDSLFKIAFMDEINDGVKSQFWDIMKVHKDYYERIDGIMILKCCTSHKVLKYYDGKIIFEYLIKEYNKDQETPILGYFFMHLYGVWNYFWPACLRNLYGQTWFGNTWVEYIAYFGNGIFIYYLLFSTIQFFSAGVRDMKRRAYMLGQLGQYISPRKIHGAKDKKLLPTINMLDKVSLHTWLDLRKLTIDYGKKYFKRHELFMPVIFQLGFMCMIFLFIVVSNIIPLGNSNSALIEKNKLSIGLACGIGYLFGLLFWMLYNAAHINRQFDKHSEILKNNKDLLEDILNFKEFYFADHINPEIVPQKQWDALEHFLDPTVDENEDSCLLIEDAAEEDQKVNLYSDPIKHSPKFSNFRPYNIQNNAQRRAKNPLSRKFSIRVQNYQSDRNITKNHHRGSLFQP